MFRKLMFRKLMFWKKKDNRQSEFLISLGFAQAKVQVSSYIIEENLRTIVEPISNAIAICKDIFIDENSVRENLLKFYIKETEKYLPTLIEEKQLLTLKDSDKVEK